jgi:F420-non-reducing hydrogenase iron-sulfur subunit
MDSNPRRIVVYFCRNLRLFKDGEKKAFARTKPNVRMVELPCSGKMEAHHVLKTIADGADGVLVLACAKKACQYIDGATRSHKRIEFAKSWLEKLGLEPDRVRYINLPPMDKDALNKCISEFNAELESFSAIPPIAKTQTA